MFTKDTRTENFLAQMGVEFEYTNKVLLTELTPGWRDINQARPVPIREDAVIEYATLMESGSPAPAPILHKGETGYSILDGVQRVAAASLAGFSRLNAAYVVSCDSSDVLAAVNVLANARLQGRAEPAEWTRRRAVEVLVIDRGLSPQEVAKMGGWQQSDIESIARVIGWQSAIESAGGPTLPATMIEVVSDCVSKAELQASGKPAADFLHLIKNAKFSAADATPHIETFFRSVAKEKKRYEVMSNRLEEFRTLPEVQVRMLGRKGPGITHDVNLRRQMRGVLTVLDEIKRSGEGLLYVDEFFKLAGEIEERLHDLSPSHKKPMTAPTPADMWS